LRFDTLNTVTEEMLLSGAWNPEQVEPKPADKLAVIHVKK
jgi:hypothetical protein